MHLEIEAKIKVENLDLYAQRLKLLGLHLKRQYTQRDYFFDRPDHSLTKADCGLRLRVQSDAKHRQIMLTYKGPRHSDAAFKSRCEIEFGVDDLNAAHDLIEALGYEVTIAFEKRRFQWLLDECSVCLDEVIEIGYFVEIEGPSEDAVFDALARLQLTDQPHITDGYAVLLAQHLKDTSRPETLELFF
ncbi:MAG: class IV adenylate cyclase [Planctomycetes bacterium]|nr:class IV adenylate cyclase [Planctomycetota bacterium]